MRIKKYTALTLQEGKSKILAELGEDAIILSSRSFNPAEDPTKTMVEIVAALDEEPVRPKKKLALPSRLIQSETKGTDDSSLANNGLVEMANIMQDEFTIIKKQLNEISENIKYRYTGALSQTLSDLYKLLISQGISEDLALKITGKLSAKNFSENYITAIAKAREIALENIRILPALRKEKERNVALFIGPTGNGKTSSLVKLAIVAKLVMDAKVLVISADTNKIGGAEQLQTYCSIAQIPFEAVYSAKELAELIDMQKDKELIFVDTTGRNPKNKEHIDELILLARAASPTFTYLVQSATVSSAVLTEIINDFSIMTPSGIILTKIDETPHIGGIIEALQEKNIPLAYITTGQKIPDDIEPASKDKIGSILIPDMIEQTQSRI